MKHLKMRYGIMAVFLIADDIYSDVNTVKVDKNVLIIYLN